VGGVDTICGDEVRTWDSANFSFISSICSLDFFSIPLFSVGWNDLSRFLDVELSPGFFPLWDNKLSISSTPLEFSATVLYSTLVASLAWSGCLKAKLPICPYVDRPLETNLALIPN